MRIERIELENWMSYPRRWPNPDEHGAEEVPPTINLTSEQLTLITGQNGSGKSAVLEGICYALFAKYPRGNQADAIRSGEGTATVRLYFSLPTDSGPVQYCVERRLKARSPSATLKQFNQDGSEIALVMGQQAVTKYIETKLLRDVTYDAFVSTVFLRQAEAGKFMELSQSKQRDQLLKLCGLDIYERIWKKASKLRQDSEKKVTNLGERFREVSYATETYLTSQKKIAENLHKKRKQLREREKIADELLR